MSATVPASHLSRTHTHTAAIITLLVGTVLAVLLFEGSLLAATPAALPSLSSNRVSATRPSELAAAADYVSAEDRLHLSLLHSACRENLDVIVPWTFGRPGLSQQNAAMSQKTLITRDDPELLAKLRQCPDVDLFLPAGIRGHGYCEDAIAYAKFLESRILPMWAIDTPLFDPDLNRTVTYHELCPKTPILFFNHFWDGIPQAPAFPKSKPVYLMPNIEMYELNEEHWWNVDVVLCKIHSCYDRVTKWYKQEGNKRDTKVFYTRHTTSDIANFARTHLGSDNLAPKNYSNIKFIHTAGGSKFKGTQQVLDCWLSRPDLPPLDLYIAEDNYKTNYKPWYADRIRASKINFTVYDLDPLSFGKVIAEASFFLCISRMEGYGHYINQARASGGVIITTDAAPMNELVQRNGMGVHVATEHAINSRQFLGGGFNGPLGLRDVEGMIALFTGEAVCQAVDHVLTKMSVDEREAMAAKAQRQYHLDTKFFAKQMLELRQFARQGGRGTFDDAP